MNSQTAIRRDARKHTPTSSASAFMMCSLVAAVADGMYVKLTFRFERTLFTVCFFILTTGRSNIWKIYAVQLVRCHLWSNMFYHFLLQRM